MTGENRLIEAPGGAGLPELGVEHLEKLISGGVRVAFSCGIRRQHELVEILKEERHELLYTLSGQSVSKDFE